MDSYFKKLRYQIKKGFTLIELMLVLVIIATLLVLLSRYYQQQTLLMRVNRTAQQMQQILNAALAFYVSNNQWPTANNYGLGCLFGDNSSQNCNIPYLIPSQGSTNTIISPWGTPFQMGYQDSTSCQNTNYTTTACALFYVWTEVSVGNRTADIATSIAGKLPQAYTSASGPANGLVPAQGSCAANATSCWVVSAINIPGQNLNNASAINFAGLYHHGGCVPMPNCPLNTVPQVFVSPVSVSGLIAPPSATGAAPEVYPISSFTAYAKAPSSMSSPTQVPACESNTPSDCSQNVIGNSTGVPGYWRVCLNIVTPTGSTSSLYQSTSAASDWGQYVTLLAVTRCGIQGEPAGSNTSIYSN